MSERDPLHAEIERLRAGESDEPYAPESVPTPGQWIRLWNDATPEKRLEWAERILANGDAKSRCFMAHGQLQERAEAADRAIARLVARADAAEAERDALRAQVERVAALAERWDAEADANENPNNAGARVLAFSAQELRDALCACPYTDPETWLSAGSLGYGGGYEPGSMKEFDPDCPIHGSSSEPVTAGPEDEGCAWCGKESCTRTGREHFEPAGEVTPPAEGATLVGSPWTNADSRELAEVLHAERHSGTFVPTLDSCTVEGCRDEALGLAGVVTPPAEPASHHVGHYGAEDEECGDCPVTPPAEQRACNCGSTRDFPAGTGICDREDGHPGQCLGWLDTDDQRSSLTRYTWPARPTTEGGQPNG